METDRKLKIYLDTSIPNHLFADDKPDWMSVTWWFWDRCIVKIVNAVRRYKEIEILSPGQFLGGPANERI
jgi:hypothetical protein